MRIWLALTALALTSLGSALPLHAQSVVGTWQIMIDGNRQVAKFTKARDGSLHGKYYDLGQDAAGKPFTASVSGRHVHFDFDEEDTSFDGELSADGNDLTGRAAFENRTFPPTTYHRATAKTAWVIDPSPHKVLFVPVEKGVQLEVLDWGGEGPPLILLPGLGNSAHVFDHFALKFTGRHHVYGISRRGFGQSTPAAPTQDNYDSDRLGDDVLAVIDALKLDRPVVAGHSMGGAEMSSIGTRHPERVSGLIYLDAAYSYAFYDPKGDTSEIDMATLHRDLQLYEMATPSQQQVLIKEMQATLPLLHDELPMLEKQADESRDTLVPTRRMLLPQIEEAILIGERKYTDIKLPVLAIFASPRACDADCDGPARKTENAARAQQANAVEAGIPHARVVRIPGADHYVFRSNEAQVIPEMNVFMDGLKR